MGSCYSEQPPGCRVAYVALRIWGAYVRVVRMGILDVGEGRAADVCSRAVTRGMGSTESHRWRCRGIRTALFRSSGEMSPAATQRTQRTQRGCRPAGGVAVQRSLPEGEVHRYLHGFSRMLTRRRDWRRGTAASRTQLAHPISARSLAPPTVCTYGRLQCGPCGQDHATRSLPDAPEPACLARSAGAGEVSGP